MVDYCLISHDSLASYSKFQVKRASEVVTEAGVQGLNAVPDHSILIWEFRFDAGVYDQNEFIKQTVPETEQGNVRYDVRNIPEDMFLNPTTSNSIFESMYNLEQGMRTQEHIDKSYDTLCSIIKNEMSVKLPVRNPVVNSFK